MDMDMGHFRLTTALLAAANGALAGAEVVRQAERLILGAPQSFVFAAIAGALIGVVILPNKDTDRVAPEPGGAWYKRALMFLARAGGLGALVLGYAMLAASTINVVVVFFHGIEAAGVSISLIAGAFIRPLLPKYLAGLESVTERLLGWVGPK